MLVYDLFAFKEKVKMNRLTFKKHVALARSARSRPLLTVCRPHSRISCTPGISKTGTELRELTAVDYFSFLEEEAGDDLVVVDFFTDWCGPCKMIYPELVLLQEQMKDKGVRIVKFNCKKENKEVAKQLDIRVAPTFFIYKKGEKIGSMTGAKMDNLLSLIQENM